jgi:hypothetical protein
MSMTVDPRLDPDVLLLSNAWPERALIRAQLIEAGFEVVALDSLIDADALVAARGGRPRVTVLQLDSFDAPRRSLERVASRLAPNALIVLTSALGLPAEDIRNVAAPAVVLERPFRIQDIVTVVRSTLDAAAR